MSIDGERLAAVRWNRIGEGAAQRYASLLGEVKEALDAGGGLPPFYEDLMDKPEDQYVELVKGRMRGDPNFIGPEADEAYQKFRQQFGEINPAEVL